MGYPGALVFLVLDPISIDVLVTGVSLAIVVQVGLVLVEHLWTIVAGVSKAIVV